jgi:transaldolase
MQIFMDSANGKAIQDAVEHGLIDGVTTNPSLIAKEGRNFREVVEEICRIVPGPVSVEVVGTTYDEMMAEGREVAARTGSGPMSPSSSRRHRPSWRPRQGQPT